MIEKMIAEAKEALPIKRILIAVEDPSETLRLSKLLQQLKGHIAIEAAFHINERILDLICTAPNVLLIDEATYRNHKRNISSAVHCAQNGRMMRVLLLGSSQDHLADTIFDDVIHTLKTTDSQMIEVIRRYLAESELGRSTGY